MPKIRSCFRLRAAGVSWKALAAWSPMLLAMGCNERDRLTFPSPSDGVGPVTTIDRPNGADTTISPGGVFFVDGRTTDPDGVDSVYILVVGGSQSFSPVHPNPARTTVSFAIPLATSGHAGETFLVQIYGVDVLGNQGGTSTRQINIRQCVSGAWWLEDTETSPTFEITSLRRARGTQPALLLDDVFAELDGDRQRRLGARLLESGDRQVFITSPRRDELPPNLELPVWEIENGRILSS